VIRHSAALVAGLLFIAPAAQAAPVLFDDRAAFDAAVGPHTTFSEFALEHVPDSLDFAADFNGLRLQREGFEINWGDTLSVNGTHTEGRAAGLFLPAASQISAIGFDLIGAWTQTGPVDIFGEPPARVPTDVFFVYTTTGGATGSTRVTGGGFAGVLLLDDAFAWAAIQTGQPGCICQSGFVLDNLSVISTTPQSVPESSTVLLFGMGLTGVLMTRRRR